MTTDEALRRAEQGMQFLAVASDLRMMTLAAQDVVEKLWPDRIAGDLARY